MAPVLSIAAWNRTLSTRPSADPKIRQLVPSYRTAPMLGSTNQIAPERSSMIDPKPPEGRGTGVARNAAEKGGWEAGPCHTVRSEAADASAGQDPERPGVVLHNRRRGPDETIGLGELLPVGGTDPGQGDEEGEGDCCSGASRRAGTHCDGLRAAP